MCGYSGFLYSSASSYQSVSNLSEKFFSKAQELKHRGNEPMRKEILPSLLLAHFRLSFQDVAHNFQPMFSQDKKWVIVFNGEIYNYPELKQKIEKSLKYQFLTNSDTEVILAGFLKYGPKIQDIIEGEYSFVICATDGSEIFALRDPFGVKPLFFFLENIPTDQFKVAQETYYFETPSLAFASEMKGLVTDKKWDREGFLRQIVGLYEPIRTPFQNIIQLPPNSFLYGRKSGQNYNTKIQLKSTAIREPLSNNQKESPNLLKDFTSIFAKSISDRMLSEVELGVYLSGGVDSSAIGFEASQYLLKNNLKKKIKSFTIGFESENYDESNDALAFAHKVGLSPNILKIKNIDLEYSYPIAAYHSENVQPFTNGAAKWWLSRFTAQHVNGVLTGDGSDEILCGYPSFKYASWWKFAKSDSLNSKEDATQNEEKSYQKKFAKDKNNPWQAGSSSEGNGDDFIESLKIWGIAHPLFSQIKTIATALLGLEHAEKWLINQKESIVSWFNFGIGATEDFLALPDNCLLLWQNYFCKTHLPNQVLNWVGDRMEMANTLEGRTPFLSKEMSKFIYQLKDNMLVRGFEDKSILRRSYKDKLSSEYAMKAKVQFGAPFLFNLQKFKIKDELISKISQTQLIEPNNVKNLLNKLNEKNFLSSISVHTHTHLLSTIQTLISFFHVDESIVKGHIPKRDLVYEENVCTKQKMI